MIFMNAAHSSHQPPDQETEHYQHPQKSLSSTMDDFLNSMYGPQRALILLKSLLNIACNNSLIFFKLWYNI